MRPPLSLCFALALVACATTPAPPPERVAGCWIDRDVGVSTMRWLTGADGALTGVRLQYGSSSGPHATRYRLLPSGEGWRLCEAAEGGGDARCWQVAEGDGGSLDGGRAFIDVAGERLRISVIGDGPERIIFSGRRDGCE
jgi:hypothetical protein